MVSSQTVTDFMKYLDQSVKDCAYYKDKLKEEDNLTQDILHKMELESPSYAERAKLATALQDCRQRRRVYKDFVSVLQPLEDWYLDKQTTHVLNALRNVLGAMRKEESYQKNRQYSPRVLKACEKEGVGD